MVINLTAKSGAADYYSECKFIFNNLTRLSKNGLNKQIYGFKEPHTYLAVAAQVSGPCAVTYITVPALLAESSVSTRGAAAPLLELPGAEAADPRSALDLGQAADIAALSVDKKVTHAAHVTIVEQRRPDLGGEDEVLARLRKST